MKSVSGALQTHFGQATTTLAVLWKLTLQNGTVLGFTSFDENIVYQSVTYLASNGFMPSANDNNSDMSVDSLAVDGFLDNVIIEEEDIRNGLYDYALVEQHIVNWADLTMGDCFLRKGVIGNIKMQNGMFVAEVRGLTQYLSTTIGSLYGPTCRAEIYSTPTNSIDPGSRYVCWVKEQDYQQTGTVGAAIDAFHLQPGFTGVSTPSYRTNYGYANSPSTIGGVSVLSLTGSALFTAGDAGVIYTRWDGAQGTFSVLSITDAGGNVWQAAPNTKTFQSGGNGSTFQVWYSVLTAAPGSIAIHLNATITGGFTFEGVGVQVSNIDTANPFAAAQGTAATTGIPQTAFIPVQRPNNILVAFLEASVALSAGSGWTGVAGLPGGSPLVEYKTTSAIGSYQGTTTGAASQSYLAEIIALQGTIATVLTQKGSVTPTAPAPSGWFNDGLITFTSGANSGFSFEIKSWDGINLTLFTPLPFALTVGDSFKIEPGCDKTPTTTGCLKFQGYSSDGFQTIIAPTNILNFRGEPFIPGTDLQLQYPDAK